MTILQEIEAFLEQSGMSAHRFGVRAGNDSGMVPRLRAGREPSAATRQKIEAFLAAERGNPSPQVKRGPKPSGGTCVDCGVKCFKRATRCRPCSGIARAGIARSKQDREAPLPADFAKVAATRTIFELRKHYGKGERTIKRWLNEAGIERSRASRFGGRELPPRPVKAETPSPRKATAPRAVWRQPGPRPLPDHRDNSRAGLAAQYLQRFGPVVRCDEKGALTPKGTHWLRGGRFILTDDEIIARAERNGWRPDARKALAA